MIIYIVIIKINFYICKIVVYGWLA